MNPDTYMRLIRFGAMLQTQQTVYAVANGSSGAATVLHWSHPLDTLLCLLATPLLLLLDPHTAVCVAIDCRAWCGDRLGGGTFCRPAVPLDRTGYRGHFSAIASYGLLGEAHHHVPMVIAAAMCGGIA
ncbi:MAG: hypothetical protein JO227_06830 [Acetobacteraceae bacterium]|nr:hypothetical protein [Acetobacteraceae bacterium]